MTAEMAGPTGRLVGRTFVVPRTSAGSTPVSAMLAAEGARVVEFPSVAIGPPPDPEAVDAAIRRIETFRWVVFAHVSATRCFLDRLITLRGDVGGLARTCRLGAVGPERRAAVEAYGLSVEATPAKSSPRALIKALAEAAGDLAGLEVLVVSGDEADSVAVGLTARGAAVTLVQSALRERNVERSGEVAELVAAGRVSGVVFLTSGGVDQFRQALEEDEALAALLPRLPAYAMSPRTAERAKALGFQELRFPSEPTREALVEAVCAGLGR